MAYAHHTIAYMLSMQSTCLSGGAWPKVYMTHGVYQVDMYEVYAFYPEASAFRQSACNHVTHEFRSRRVWHTFVCNYKNHCIFRKLTSVKWWGTTFALLNNVKNSNSLKRDCSYKTATIISLKMFKLIYSVSMECHRGRIRNPTWWLPPLWNSKNWCHGHPFNINFHMIWWECSWSGENVVTLKNNIFMLSKTHCNGNAVGGLPPCWTWSRKKLMPFLSLSDHFHPIWWEC